MFRSSVFKLLNNCVVQKCINHPLPYICSTKLLIRDNRFTNLSTVRNYAKGKNKIKEDKGKGKKKNIEINEAALSEVINIEKFKSELEHDITIMKEIFITQLTLRSSTGAIDNLIVKFDGKKYVLMELAQILRKDHKTVIINMNDFPQAAPAVMKALASSGMNLNPQQDGTSIYVPVPKVTREHREVLAKNARAQFFKCRDAIHSVQNKYLKSLKNQVKEGLSEDTFHQLSEQVNHLGDTYVDKAEKILELKNAELLGEAH